MSSAAECRPFSLRANEIRYQYVYHRQKLGIYIFVWVYTLNRGWGGCHYDDCTAPQVVITTTRTGDPLHSRALAHSRAPLFTQPCPHCSHSRAPGEQWARLCVFTLQGCVQAARLCRGSPVTRCHKRPHSRHTDSPSPQWAIHRSNINYSKAVHIWHEHVGPGHDLIKDLNSCSESAIFMFMGSMFHTCAP